MFHSQTRDRRDGRKEPDQLLGHQAEEHRGW